MGKVFNKEEAAFPKFPTEAVLKNFIHGRVPF